jgi:hypothetical protein
MGSSNPAHPALATILLVSGFVVAAAGQAIDAPLPDRAEFVRRVREGVRLDYELQTQYTYVEKRRDVRLSRLGKVYVGPMRTFEVYPSKQPGRTYKRLVAVDGKPLDSQELARRDEEHRQNVLAEVEREKSETPAQRDARLKKLADERQERDAMVNDAFTIYAATLTARERIDGEPVIVATLSPRQHVEPKTREGRWMKKFEGRIWVSELDHQIVKIDMVANDDISIGLGIVGRVHKGSRLVFARRKVNGEAWLPAESRIEASGRTMLFRTFQISMRTEFFDYRKWSVESSVTFTAPPGSF